MRLRWFLIVAALLNLIPSARSQSVFTPVGYYVSASKVMSATWWSARQCRPNLLCYKNARIWDPNDELRRDTQVHCVLVKPAAKGAARLVSRLL